MRVAGTGRYLVTLRKPERRLCRGAHPLRCTRHYRPQPPADPVTAAQAAAAAAGAAAGAAVLEQDRQ